MFYFFKFYKSQSSSNDDVGLFAVSKECTSSNMHKADFVLDSELKVIKNRFADNEEHLHKLALREIHQLGVSLLQKSCSFDNEMLELDHEQGC